MDEQHECKWAVDYQLLLDDLDPMGNPKGECFAYCGCGEELRCQEIQTRLNEYETLKKATERLSALQAKELIVFALGSTRISQPEHADALKAYADILEGK